MSEFSVPVITRGNAGELLDCSGALSQGALLLVDKPAGWTSFDVVAKGRRLLKVKKVGHAGTLDPMATGLLVLCIGRATKLADQVQAGEKEYTGTIRFGATTPTDDAESEEEETFPTDHLTADGLRAGAAAFVGDSMQRPPMFSARKVAGQRLYKLARRGETVEVPPKMISVAAFDIEACPLPDASFRIVCSKGTYIRSLARDLGRNLGSGAYLTSLRRTRSGQFLVEDALTMPELQEICLQKEATH